jgi:uncharacterized protein YcfL
MKKLITVVALLMLVACGSKLNQENLNKVQSGMTETEVKAALGSPTASESSSALGMTGSVYTYKSGENEVKITFVNGKVFTVAGSFSK